MGRERRSRSRRSRVGGLDTATDMLDLNALLDDLDTDLDSLLDELAAFDLDALLDELARFDLAELLDSVLDDRRVL